VIDDFLHYEHGRNAEFDFIERKLRVTRGDGEVGSHHQSNAEAMGASANYGDQDARIGGNGLVQCADDAEGVEWRAGLWLVTIAPNRKIGALARERDNVRTFGALCSAALSCRTMSPVKAFAAAARAITIRPTRSSTLKLIIHPVFR
jgi:hypothetical protein